MAYDLRDFIEDLKRAGELVEINDEVDWNYEISAYELLAARFGGPALLFNKIKGSMEGSRVLTGMFSGPFTRPHKRAAIAFGLDPNLDRAEWLGALAHAMGNMLRPVEVTTGPCKEVIKTGKEVNLLELPFTYHAIGDGGRYIIFSATVIKDPDSNWLNSGTYSIEVFSRNRLVPTPHQHTNFFSIFTNKYQGRGQSMPVAVCLGADPAITMAAGVIMPPGITEYDLAGGLRGTPVELVRAETSDLLVPANAEVIIEGEVRPYEMLPEGPKIETFGFSVGPREPSFAMRVHCITHRKNPILMDGHTPVCAGADSLQETLLPAAGLSQVRTYGLPIKLATMGGPARNGSTEWKAVIKKKLPEDYPGFMEDLFDKTMGIPGLSVCINNVFVDDDVNIMDLSEAYEALFTQTNPNRDWIRTTFRNPSGTLQCSWMEEDDRGRYTVPGAIRSPKMLVDATTKEEPPLGVKRLNFETLYPKHLQEWVINNWRRLGFTEEPRSNRSWLEAKF